jgi:hypothetical protein
MRFGGILRVVVAGNAREEDGSLDVEEKFGEAFGCRKAEIWDVGLE